MGPCIIMLQHEVMVVDEWQNIGPPDLVTVSLCIQNVASAFTTARHFAASCPLKARVRQ